MFCVRVNKNVTESTRNVVVVVYIDASCIYGIYTCFIKDKINTFIPVNTCSTRIYIYINDILHSVKWGKFKKYNNIV